MATAVESAVSSMRAFRLGWHDTIARKIGKELPSAADPEAYSAGVDAASKFIRAVSAVSATTYRESGE